MRPPARQGTRCLGPLDAAEASVRWEERRTRRGIAARPDDAVDGPAGWVDVGEWPWETRFDRLGTVPKRGVRPTEEERMRRVEGGAVDAESCRGGRLFNCRGTIARCGCELGAWSNSTTRLLLFTAAWDKE
jgi:hypothetical protein